MGVSEGGRIHQVVQRVAIPRQLKLARRSAKVIQPEIYLVRCTWSNREGLADATQAKSRTKMSVKGPGMWGDIEKSTLDGRETRVTKLSPAGEITRFKPAVRDQVCGRPDGAQGKNRSQRHRIESDEFFHTFYLRCRSWLIVNLRQD